ncbi:Guanylate kinase [hydrothermal vent metagenome]|uniref:guanylate kinase n=1 Tax=hydrothermal vent metagenome TaxID=652676 RepID=A0A3B0Z7E8_9ZZZZ
MSVATLFIVSAASGAGKTSLVKALLAQDKKIAVSVSHTTRDARAGEQHGKDYFFVGKVEFNRMIESGHFIEHAQVFDNNYGTSEQEVRRMLANGIDVILEIDWQGAVQVRKKFEAAVGIFIVPPSAAELRKRLEGRGKDSTEIIERRMRDAVSEMSHFGEFDYLVVNDDFEQALQELSAIVNAQRLQMKQQKLKLEPLLSSLLATATD